MRNRILQKTFWTSEEILELELHERLLFLGMTNYADDEGIIKTSPKALKAKIFPADNISIEKINNALFKMRELGLIRFNIDGTLCRFTSWYDFQKINRPYPSKFNFVEESGDDSVNVHGTLTHHSSPNNNNNSKNKNKKNNNKTNKYSNEFESFWKSYPRKVAKSKCSIKFEQQINNYGLENVMIGTEVWVDYWDKTRKDVEFIPHPYTFLSQERFMDIPDDIKTQIEVEYRLDTTGKFFIGYCSKCEKSSFYKKEQLSQDSRCCNERILPQREPIDIQDINAKA